MKITGIKKFLVGGAMEAPVEDPAMAPAPEGGAPEQGGDPLMLMALMAMLALQSLDCQMAMSVCQAFVEMVQQAQGGGAPAEQPVYRKGGVLVRRIKK